MSLKRGTDRFWRSGTHHVWHGIETLKDRLGNMGEEKSLGLYPGSMFSFKEKLGSFLSTVLLQARSGTLAEDYTVERHPNLCGSATAHATWRNDK